MAGPAEFLCEGAWRLLGSWRLARSGVVRFDLYDAPRTGSVPPAFFDAVVRAAFSQRRKTLPNSLAARFGKDRARAALSQAGIDLQSRAEALDLAQFVSLAEALEDKANADNG